MHRPRVLDLFCCGGGAARGYALAGFEVVGVDIEAQPSYPFEFHQADAVEYLLAHGHGFDLIHASPPCQGYSSHVVSPNGENDRTMGKNAPRLIHAVREAAISVGKPYIIENVVGAKQELRRPMTLCGLMFGLAITRHRLIETSLPIRQPTHVACKGVGRFVAHSRGWEYRDMSVTGKGRRAGTAERWKWILGLDANDPMTQHQLRECIPPAYTEYLGLQVRMHWLTKYIRQRG